MKDGRRAQRRGNALDGTFHADYTAAMPKNLPNILTIARLVAAPLVALAMALLPRPLADWVAFALFAGASVTDWLDGRIARARNLESRLGAVLDPIADKAMVLIALLMLAALSRHGVVLAIPAALIVFREVLVSGLREGLGTQRDALKVTGLAKWKTAVQMLAIGLLLLERAVATGTVPGSGGNALGTVGVALLWVAAALTVVTGWDYCRKAWPLLASDER